MPGTELQRECTQHQAPAPSRSPEGMSSTHGPSPTLGIVSTALSRFVHDEKCRIDTERFSELFEHVIVKSAICFVLDPDDRLPTNARTIREFFLCPSLCQTQLCDA